MPYYESNEPYQVDSVSNGALIGGVMGAAGMGAAVTGAAVHYRNMDDRLDAKRDNLMKKRSSMYEKANNMSDSVDEKVSKMKMNPVESARKTAGDVAKNYYKPAYDLERKSSGGPIFDSEEEVLQDKANKRAAFERYQDVTENSKITQWGQDQSDAAHESFTNRQSKKREKILNNVSSMRQEAHSMQGEINHLNDAQYRSKQKSNHLYAKHLGGWKNALAVGGAAAIGAVGGAFMDAAATNEVRV